MNIADPVEYRPGMTDPDPASDFTQRLATSMSGLTAQQPSAFWLWHPIPNDPFLSVAQRRWPELLKSAVATVQDDEDTALAVEALSAETLSGSIAGPSPAR
jgi:hypothetical protein